MLKGSAAVGLGMLIAALLDPSASAARHGGALGSVCCARPHLPVWLRFKGGKGVATAFLASSWWPRLAAWGGYCGLRLFVLRLSRYVSLASILGAAAFPLLRGSP